MRQALLTLLIAATLAATSRAEASLGGNADSVEADRKTLAAARRPTIARAGYAVHEVDLGATRVREYVSPAGVVFAVAWKGLAHPDLTPLLGSYASTYREADRQTPRQPGRRYRQVRADRLVVERWGHLRNFQGRAYDPTLIPPGVALDDLR
jgi:hypothetical protein